MTEELGAEQQEHINQVLSNVNQYVESDRCNLPNPLKGRIREVIAGSTDRRYYEVGINDSTVVEVTSSMVADALDSFMKYTQSHEGKNQYIEWGVSSVRGRFFRVVLGLAGDHDYPEELIREVDKTRNNFSKISKVKSASERPYEESITTRIVVYLSGNADTCVITPMIIFRDESNGDGLELPVLQSTNHGLSKLVGMESGNTLWSELDLEERIVYRLVNKQVSLGQCRQVLAWLRTKEDDAGLLKEDPLNLILIMQTEYTRAAISQEAVAPVLYDQIAHAEGLQNFHFLTLDQISKIIHIQEGRFIKDEEVIKSLTLTLNSIYPGLDITINDIANALVVTPELRGLYRDFVARGFLREYEAIYDILIERGTADVLLYCFTSSTLDRVRGLAGREVVVRNRLRAAVFSLEDAYYQGTFRTKTDEKTKFSLYHYLAVQLVKYENRGYLAGLFPGDLGIFIGRVLTEGHIFVVGSAVFVPQINILYDNLRVIVPDMQFDRANSLHRNEGEGLIIEYYPSVIYRLIYTLNAIRHQQIEDRALQLLQDVGRSLGEDAELRSILEAGERSGVIKRTIAGVALNKGKTNMHGVDIFEHKLWIALGAFYGEVAKEQAGETPPETQV